MPETSQYSATQWGLFELALNGPSEGNPFRDVELGATFESAGRKVEATGFYDGDGVYRIRFMPDATGTWTYRTRSNVAALDGRTGMVEVGTAKPGDHGPVCVANTFHFAYADGTRFVPVGTTAYAWNHQGEAMEQQTLATLATAPFTKIRMCVFPKHYRYNENEPEFYPYPVTKRGTSAWSPGLGADGGWAFDFERFDPAFFRHLEQRIADLGKIGVEADLIVFHPYDRWGFSRMSAEQDDAYLRYLMARLSALPNVWWSLANEYDLMPSKSLDDWNRFIGIIATNDPYGHLRSNHNCFAFFDYNHPQITHCSIQRPDPARTVLWRERYKKPVLIDECCYEGDIAEAWGNISGRELVHRFWDGMVNGGYVTHGETFGNAEDKIWWAKGGKLIGESIPRIAYLRKLIKSGPATGVDPIDSVPRHIMLSGGMDKVNLQTLTGVFRGKPGEPPRVPAHFLSGGDGTDWFLTYFGENQPSEVAAAVPEGGTFIATVIDTWEMTETEIASGVVRGQVLRFKPKPYQALLLRRA